MIKKRLLPVLLAVIGTLQVFAIPPGKKKPVPLPVPFEGTITTKVLVGDLDISVLTENIDYSKGNIQQQMAGLASRLPKEQLEKFRKLTETNPMMGLVVAMTPPKCTIAFRNGVAVARTRGLGYQIEHYHSAAKDEAYIYTASLIDSSNAVTATYKPSSGYAQIFSGDKFVNPDDYTITTVSEKVTIAGYSCTKSIYTSKAAPAAPQSTNGMPAMALQKLVVYSSDAIPTDINFSHPYYLPEKRGIMRIDIYFDKSDTPAMVYEVVDVNKAPVSDHALSIHKTEPMFQLTNENMMEYGMKLMGIIMGGMSQSD